LATSGYRFSATKSLCIIFSKLRKYNTLQIKINDLQIATSKTINILGIIFDSKNTWCTHLRELREVSTIRINTLKALSHTSWELTHFPSNRSTYPSYYPSSNTVPSSS
jgi:hypothetical protein